MKALKHLWSIALTVYLVLISFSKLVQLITVMYRDLLEQQVVEIT